MVPGELVSADRQRWFRFVGRSNQALANAITVKAFSVGVPLGSCELNEFRNETGSRCLLVKLYLTSVHHRVTALKVVLFVNEHVANDDC